METCKILFVDDETYILDGIKRMLRQLRREFDSYFAENASQALDLMQEIEFDVVVSDMRMQGMNGAQLLAEVQKKHPHTIRIMLTAQSDEEAIFKTVGVVHQFLYKPCDPENLKKILLRARSLHGLMKDGKLKNIISRIDSLPSLPDLYIKLQERLREPETSVNDIGVIISEDIAMTAKILQLVNSAFFGLYQKVDNPVRAVTLLGIDTIKSLVLVCKVFSEIKISKDVFSADALWNHSMMVGSLAKKIAESEVDDKALIDNCFIAGLLHEIGQLILASKMENIYKQAFYLAKTEKISFPLAEKKVCSTTHYDMGAYLLGLWGFNSDIVEAIGFFHRLEDYPANTFTPALAVHIANVMYYKNHEGEIIGKPPEINKEYISKIGLGDSLRKWDDLCSDFLMQQLKA